MEPKSGLLLIERELAAAKGRLASSQGDDLASLRAFGHDVVAALCARLLDGGAPGIHFYTLNQPGPSRALWQAVAR